MSTLRHAVLAGFALALLLGCTDPDDPVTSPATTSPEPAPGPGGAEAIEPEPGVAENVRSRQFDRAEISDGGTEVDVFYIGGVQECWVLDRVEVERIDPATVELTIFEGSRPQAEVCIDLGVSYVTTVTLEEPLADGGVVVDGTDGQIKS
jgi:hypothetical protein